MSPPSADSNDVVQLNTVNNPWRSSRFGELNHNINPNDLHRQYLGKRFIGLLNKVTPENFNVICQQLRQLEIHSTDLNYVMLILHGKAISEPIYLKIYVLLSHFIDTLRVINLQGENEPTNFTTLLLTKCLDDFEKDNSNIASFEKRISDINGITDVQLRLKLLEDIQKDKIKARKCAIGNTRLIGELYMANLVEILTIYSCIEKLLTSLDEGKIERLCTLLRTIGSKFMYELRQIASPNSTFEREIIDKLDQISNCEYSKEQYNLSSRIRFMVLDVLDMSKNNWREREVYKQVQPRTLREIRSELIQVEE